MRTGTGRPRGPDRAQSQGPGNPRQLPEGAGWTGHSLAEAQGQEATSREEHGSPQRSGGSPRQARGVSECVASGRRKAGPVLWGAQRWARSWLHPGWAPVGPSRGSAVASVSGVQGAGEALLGWVSQLLPHPTPVLIGIPHGERQKHNQKCSSKKKDTMVLGRLFRLEHFQLGSKHIRGPPFPQLASGRPPCLYSPLL